MFVKIVFLGKIQIYLESYLLVLQHQSGEKKWAVYLEMCRVLKEQWGV